MKKYIEIWDDIILFDIIWKIECFEEENWLSTSFFDKKNNLINDIYECYEDIEYTIWMQARKDFKKYLDNK